jgi:type II secretory pathway pseudopilin PulG
MKRCFSLSELVIVVTVFLALAFVAIPNLLRARIAAHESTHPIINSGSPNYFE